MKRVLASCVNIFVNIIIPAFTNPFILCSLIYSCISTTHFAYSGFRLFNFRETLISPASFPFVSWRLTLSEYHLLNWFETNLFAFYLIVKSSGWSLLVKLWGTMTNLQLVSNHNDLISSLSWPLKVSIMITENCSCGYPSSILSLVDITI